MLPPLPAHIVQRSAVGLSVGFLLGFELTQSTHRAVTDLVIVVDVFLHVILGMLRLPSVCFAA